MKPSLIILHHNHGLRIAILVNPKKEPYLRITPGSQLQKGAKWPENLENHTPFRGTYLYSLSMAVLPRGLMKESASLTATPSFPPLLTTQNERCTETHFINSLCFPTPLFQFTASASAYCYFLLVLFKRVKQAIAKKEETMKTLREQHQVRKPKYCAMITLLCVFIAALTC